MRNFNLISFLFFFGSSSITFCQYPGNVKGFSFWHQASENSTMADSLSFINFNNATRIINGDELNGSEDVGIHRKITFFAVYQPYSSNSNIMKLHNELNDVYLNTEGVSSKEQLEFQPKTLYSSKPVLVAYAENLNTRQKTEPDAETNPSRAIEFGNSLAGGQNREMFRGRIAEIIVYPRVLKKLNRRKIETYLSLKYGISLDTGLDYVNSKGDTIWNASKEDTFIYRVTGIGKDIASHLNQKQSSNMEEENLMTIGLGNISVSNKENTQEVADLNFMLWSDNGKELRFIEDEQNKLSQLQRTWKAKTIGSDISKKNISFEVSTSFLEKDSADSENLYWLVIDPDSEREINLMHSVYISPTYNRDSLKVTFSNVGLSDINKDKFLFGLIKAPEFFAVHELTNQDCENNVSVRFIGGEPPYHLEFKNKNNGNLTNRVADEDSVELQDMDPGPYEYTVTDSKGSRYHSDFELNHEIFSRGFTMEDIILVPGNIHVIDLSEKLISGEIERIDWYKGEEPVGQGEIFNVRTEGEYRLELKTGKGCQYEKSFTAAILPEGNWSGIYPNPAGVNKTFYIKLNEIAMFGAQITIRDNSGRIVNTAKLKPGTDLYAYTLPYQGIYTVTIESQTENHSYQLIVK